MLSRAAARGREMGIRLALGATRARLVRQLLTESLLLSLVGGAAGLAMASWGTDLLLGFAEIPNDLAGSMSPDLRVFSFTLALSILSGVFFGLAPALHASRRDLAPVLKGDRSGPPAAGGGGGAAAASAGLLAGGALHGAAGERRVVSGEPVQIRPRRSRLRRAGRVDSFV